MIPGRVNPLHTMVAVNQEMFGPGTVATSDDAVTMGLQAATHWDALTHVSHSGRIYNGRPADTVTAHGRAAVQRHRQGAATSSRAASCSTSPAPGARTGCPGATPSPPKTSTRPRSWPGTRSGPGDIALVRTGQIQQYLAGDKQAYAFPSPGLSLRTPEWFHARDVAAVANDTLTFEIFPPEIENLWLPRARPRPGRDGHAAGPELESGGAVRQPAPRRGGTRSCCRRCPSRSSAEPAPRSRPWRSSDRRGSATAAPQLRIRRVLPTSLGSPRSLREPPLATSFYGTPRSRHVNSDRASRTTFGRPAGLRTTLVPAPQPTLRIAAADMRRVRDAFRGCSVPVLRWRCARARPEHGTATATRLQRPGAAPLSGRATPRHDPQLAEDPVGREAGIALDVRLAARSFPTRAASRDHWTSTPGLDFANYARFSPSLDSRRTRFFARTLCGGAASPRRLERSRAGRPRTVGSAPGHVGPAVIKAGQHRPPCGDACNRWAPDAHPGRHRTATRRRRRARPPKRLTSDRDPHSPRNRTFGSPSPGQRIARPRVINQTRHVIDLVPTLAHLVPMAPSTCPSRLRHRPHRRRTAPRRRDGDSRPAVRPPCPRAPCGCYGRSPPSARPAVHSHQMRLPPASGLQPQRSARPSTSSRPRPLVSSPSA